MAFRIGQTPPTANNLWSDLRGQSNTWSIDLCWAETLHGAGAAFARRPRRRFCPSKSEIAGHELARSRRHCVAGGRESRGVRHAGPVPVKTVTGRSARCAHPGPHLRSRGAHQTNHAEAPAALQVWAPRGPNQLVCLWLPIVAGGALRTKATASASLRAQGSHRPRAVLAMLARETDAPGPCTTRPSCRPKSPLPKGKQNRRPRARLPRKVQS